ncbi:hypothetical protein KQ939_08535 [Planococcus sp. CP5-4]|uniref:hypothetical protein n=1 Tax=unclassified Planococcus (in: firmicutes) TaxID=2662419 RepID=UPI001C244124|nr:MULTISPECIES: hypothetical protein [unclassified Planococcus (in: firmicutes)]MBU9674262.1 hypothetical protein [Planococcus sp. CP5-4_YE]MBV0909266.1 hypothetical protein [Planococcus sp. CP5-4_UN]MBW6063758.1 hypothetical protein [Planococcus sp. CP5-4]
MDMPGGITVALIIFGLFLLITGLLVGSILMMLKKSKSNQVDDVPDQQTPVKNVKVEEQDTPKDDHR